MTSEEALKIIEQTEANYTQKQRVLRGMNILAKYDDTLSTEFEHDQIYVGSFHTLVGTMSVEEVTEMAVLGWFESEDAWSHF